MPFFAVCPWAHNFSEASVFSKDDDVMKTTKIIVIILHGINVRIKRD